MLEFVVRFDLEHDMFLRILCRFLHSKTIVMVASALVMFSASTTGAELVQILFDCGTASFPFLAGSNSLCENSHCCNNLQVRVEFE